MAAANITRTAEMCDLNWPAMIFLPGDRFLEQITKRIRADNSDHQRIAGRSKSGVRPVDEAAKIVKEHGLKRILVRQGGHPRQRPRRERQEKNQKDTRALQKFHRARPSAGATSIPAARRSASGMLVTPER